MSRLFAKTMVVAIAGFAVLALSSQVRADEAVVETGSATAQPAALVRPVAIEQECTDAKCAACEAGTCSDADCPAKACAEGSCEQATCAACEAGTCTGEGCPLKTAAGKQVASAAAVEANMATPTHRQTKIIKANQTDLSNTKLNCFGMTRDGRILAGCGTSSDNGEIRVFDSNGDYVETWSIPVKVEAVNVRASDGMVFVAGNGRLVKFDDTGNLIADKPSPHATLSKEQAAKLREAVIAQLQQRADMYRRQEKIYDQQIEIIGGQIEKLNQKLAELDEQASEADSDEVLDAVAESEGAVVAPQPTTDTRRKMMEQQLAQLERSQTSLQRTKKLWNQRIEQLGDAEPSEEDIDRQVESQIARKLAVASVSAVGDTVFIACSAAAGYGYSVWAIDDNFEAGEEIVTDLRGCCGQMDVQANDRGIYVAENSRDRVVCFDHQGSEVTHWGHSAREGIRGFGSCCNPMNVAFGPDSTVYTAESGSGRIKQYSADGELLQVVGAADLVPGCKKVSIGASSDGSRVFMLDITRDHIVMMEAIPADERDEMVAKSAADAEQADEKSQATSAQADQTQASKVKSKSTSSAVARVLLSPFMIGD